MLNDLLNYIEIFLDGIPRGKILDSPLADINPVCPSELAVRAAAAAAAVATTRWWAARARAWRSARTSTAAAGSSCRRRRASRAATPSCSRRSARRRIATVTTTGATPSPATSLLAGRCRVRQHDEWRRRRRGYARPRWVLRGKKRPRKPVF